MGWLLLEVLDRIPFVTKKTTLLCHARTVAGKGVKGGGGARAQAFKNDSVRFYIFY